MKALPTPRTPDPKDAPPLRWGILAPGSIGHTFTDALAKHTRQQVVAVGSRSAERASAFASEFGLERSYGSYDELVADPEVDAIYVASPHNFHEEHTLLALEAGKHVLCEKIFTTSKDSAQRMVDAARRADRTLMEAMWTRFLPSHDIVRQLLADGALGELELVSADHGQWFDGDSRLLDPDQAGGAMNDLGIYPVSFAVFALGLPGATTVTGTRTDKGLDRQFSGVLHDFADHPHAHAVITSTLAADTPTRASICGELARVELPFFFYGPQQVHLITRDGDQLVSDEPTIRGHEGLAHEAAHFAQLVADGQRTSPLLPLDESVAIVGLAEQIRDGI